MWNCCFDIAKPIILSYTILTIMFRNDVFIIFFNQPFPVRKAVIVSKSEICCESFEIKNNTPNKYKLLNFVILKWLLKIVLPFSQDTWRYF